MVHWQSCYQCDFKFSRSSALIEEAWKNPHWGWTLWLLPMWLRFSKSSALIEEAWKNPHWGWTLWLLPVWLRVFKIKCSYWRSMIKPTQGMNPSGVLIVTSSFQSQVLWLRKHEITHTFQHQVLLLKKHERSHTRDEPLGCSHFDFKFSKSSTLRKHEITHTF